MIPATGRGRSRAQLPRVPEGHRERDRRRGRAAGGRGRGAREGQHRAGRGRGRGRASRTTSSATSDAPKTGCVTLREDLFAGRARDMARASASCGRAAMVRGSPRPGGPRRGIGAPWHRPLVRSGRVGVGPADRRVSLRSRTDQRARPRVPEDPAMQVIAVSPVPRRPPRRRRPEPVRRDPPAARRRGARLVEPRHVPRERVHPVRPAYPAAGRRRHRGVGLLDRRARRLPDHGRRPPGFGHRGARRPAAPR